VPDLLLRRLPPAAALGGAIAAGRPEALARELLGVTLNLFDVVGRFVIVVALSAYWSASRSSFERLWLSFVPATRRGRARDIWRHVDAGVGAHVRSEIGQSLATVLVLAGLFQYVGLPVPVLTALGAGLFRLVPLVGLFFAVLMAFLAGAAVDLPLGVVAAAATATVIVLLDQLVARRLCQTRPFSGTLVVLMVVALTDAYGILGLALAAPLAAAVQILLERLLATQPTRSRRVLRLSDMEQRLSRLRRLMARSATPGSSEVASLVGRLEHVVGEAREIPELTPQPEVGQGGAAWELSPSTPMIREPPRGR
jgi:predicted PurR-regulated permease PerM